MAIETDEEWHQRGVDALEAEIAADDIADATIVGTGHADHMFQNDFRQKTTKQTQGKDAQQMDIGLPLPHFESERLEDGQRQYDEGAADNTDADGFVKFIIHNA